jgi:prevent-host-death family protein
MKRRFTATRLRANLYRVLDEVLETGRPVEIERNGRVLRIVAAEPEDPLERLEPHPEAVRGDLDSLADLDWSHEWKPFL